MKSQAEKMRREEFREESEPFRRNAFKIIKQMVVWCNKTPGSKVLVDEILHSIFFFGIINKPDFPPEKIICDTDLLRELKRKYPRPFQLYCTQIPRRSPFSCVLDMIVLMKGQQNDNQILEMLQDFVNGLEKKYLVSTTICVSKKSEKAAKYYGVSMSASGCNPGRIAIAGACFSFWDEYVAGAVLTYYPVKKQKEYFDGTIKVPDYVSCQAFGLCDLKKMAPCKACGDLFGLHTNVQKAWAYGNCAEAECLSNLLKNEPDVKKAARPTSNKCTPDNRKKAQDSAWKELKNSLRTQNFTKWDNTIYTPSS